MNILILIIQLKHDNLICHGLSKIVVRYFATGKELILIRHLLHDNGKGYVTCGGRACRNVHY
jgi:hypothetical protein